MKTGVKMCGINGFTWRDVSLIEKMNSVLTHRGPDDQGIYTDDKVSLGGVRLSIIDLSPSGRQPMCNEDKTVWILHNGEVYNFLELRKELEEKHIFRSNTDTEVILHAYEEWGTDCVKKFNGMWAFAIYDKKNSILFLSRDRFGIKPLYYIDSEGFIFSSEIKGILQHDSERIPNDKIIYEYLAFNLLDHSRETFFNYIYRVMPGENLIYDISQKTYTCEKWFNLKLELSDHSFDQAVKTLQTLFSDSVQYRLIADVDVGSCLSGGVDSSALVCTMNRLRNRKLKTFSLVFPGSEIDETFYIDEVVKSTGVKSYRVTPTIKDLIADLYDLIETQEEPFSSLSIYGQYKVMELAHINNMKVLLDGQGGDELFAGYPGYYRYYLLDCLKNLRLGEFFKILKQKKDINFILFLGKVLLMRFNISRKLLQYIQFKNLKVLTHFYKGNLFKEKKGLNQALFYDLTMYSIPQLLRYEDKNSMRWSIEARVPFLDYRIAAFATGLPPHYKLHNGVTKYLFRNSMEGLIPEKILKRRDKIGFAVPDAEWMVTPEFAEVLTEVMKSPLFRSRKYWKHKEVEKLYHRKGSAKILWKILNVELWLRIFIDKKEGKNGQP
jgi:asparagine synthase (glutamine-hydrolysing)